MSSTAELYSLYQESTGISTDSRKIEKGNLFFALKGENFDGNKYAGAALQKGASYAIIEDESYASEHTLVVDDVLASLQDLAGYHRNKLNIPVIGLTGTNGKTTSKELIKEVLAKKYRVHATYGNLNNHIGVPLTVLGIKPDTEIAVIEMGANHIGEIAELCSIAKPTHGMITNIGKAHLEGFGGYEGVIKAKSEIYSYLRNNDNVAFVNGDDELLMTLSDGIERSTYGSMSTYDTYGSINRSVPFLGIRWRESDIQTHLYGDYNFQNVLVAICIGSFFGVRDADIVNAIAEYRPTNNRSQVVKSKSNTIFLDAYNANPSSMMVSIDQFSLQPGDKKVLILGDMLELGNASKEEHLSIIDKVENGFQTVILVGPEFMDAYQGNKCAVFEHTQQAGIWLENNPIRDAQILIKGSRGIALEKLLPFL